MGGGDLNLKKSWHPSTLRNIERVWKAEQKHEVERQKIEQLQKELAEERAREEIQTYAQDQGVVRKREERLDWMYQGPAAMVNREDYLMGRKIDKTLELLEHQESGVEPKKEDFDVGPTMFSSQDLSGTATVDLANKIREDPLFNIMKKEKEQRKNLLSNPVKMKQLQQLIQESLGKKKSKKSKKQKKHSDSDSEERRHHKKHKKEKHHRHSTPESDEDVMLMQEKSQNSHKKTKKEDEYEIRSSSNSYRSKLPHNGSPSERQFSYEQSYRNSETYSSRSYKDKDSERYCSTSQRERESEKYLSNSCREKDSEKYFSSSHREKDFNTSRREKESEEYFNSSYKEKTSNKYASSSHRDKYSNTYSKSSQREKDSDGLKRKLDAEERERRLKEMEDNAKWRDQQREKNFKRYKEEDEKEDGACKMDASDFIKPMLSKAAEKGSLENRVKQKIFSIQRGSGIMDKHFARR